MKQCWRKVHYATQDEAEQALADVRHERGRPKGHNVRKAERRAYFCPWCKSWHLTSQAAA